MTITPFEMYLITRLGAINGTLVVGMIVGTFVSIILGAMYLYSHLDQIEHESSYSQYSKRENDANLAKKRTVVLLRKSFKAFSIATAAFWILWIAIPTTRQLAAIYVIPAIVNSEVVQEKVPETMNGIFALAEAWIEELKPEKEGKQ